MRFLVIIAVLTLLGFVYACDEGRTVRIENHTSEPVQLIEDGKPTRTIAPGDTLEGTALAFDGVGRITHVDFPGLEFTRVSSPLAARFPREVPRFGSVEPVVTGSKAS